MTLPSGARPSAPPGTKPSPAPARPPRRVLYALATAASALLLLGGGARWLAARNPGSAADHGPTGTASPPRALPPDVTFPAHAAARPVDIRSGVASRQGGAAGAREDAGARDAGVPGFSPPTLRVPSERPPLP